MPDEKADAWWSRLPHHLFLALAGFFFWWLQDLAETNKAQVEALLVEQRQIRRELDSLTFQLKNLSERLLTHHQHSLRWPQKPDNMLP